MSATASQNTSLTIVYWTFYSGVDQRKHQSSASQAFLRGGGGNSPVTDVFPAQMASNTENVSIWWRHYEFLLMCDVQYMWTGAFSYLPMNSAG